MTIFDSIKYPIVDFEDARNTFPLLPESIRKDFNKWYVESGVSRPSGYHQLAHLRKLIGEYNDDI